MSDHFYPTDGTKALKKLRDLKPDTFKAFVEFDKKAFEEGALNVKTKELIAIAVGHVTQCPYCIDVHTKKAIAAGATEQEVAESNFLAIPLTFGGFFGNTLVSSDA